MTSEFLQKTKIFYEMNNIEIINDYIAREELTIVVDKVSRRVQRSIFSKSYAKEFYRRVRGTGRNFFTGGNLSDSGEIS